MHNDKPPPVASVRNPFLQETWDRHDLMLALVFAQTSSGREGEDVINRAEATLVAHDAWLAKEAEKDRFPCRIEINEIGDLGQVEMKDDLIITTVADGSTRTVTRPLRCARPVAVNSAALEAWHKSFEAGAMNPRDGALFMRARGVETMRYVLAQLVISAYEKVGDRESFTLMPLTMFKPEVVS